MIVAKNILDDILSGSIYAVAQSLADGVNINQPIDGQLPLTHAILNGGEDVAVYLIQNGADITIRSIQPEIEPSQEENWIDYVLIVLSTVFQVLAVQEIWLSILAMEVWPQQLRLLQAILASQKLLCYPLHQLLFALLSAIYHRRLWEEIKRQISLLPTYLGFYILGVKMGGLNSSSQNIVRILTLYALGKFHNQMRETPSMRIENIFGGTSAVRAAIKYKGSSGKSAKALLEQGFFSSEQIKEGIKDMDSDVLALWWWANKRGYDAVVRHLLDLGFPPLLKNNREGESALEGAARLGHFTKDETTTPENRTILAELILRGADVNTFGSHRRTPISFAARAGDLIAFDMLLKHGANANIADNTGKTPILLVPSTEDGLVIIRRLVQAGADVNHADNEGFTLLLEHVRLSNTETVKVLLAEGADPLLRTKDGRTAMQMASRYCMSEMMRVLLEAGADPQACNCSGQEPILLASQCHMERAEAFSILLKAGANLNVSNETGETPLNLVCKRYSTTLSNTHDYSDQLLVVNALIKYGADVNATYTDVRVATEQNVTPIGLAARHAPSSIKEGLIRALLEAGAHPDGLDDYGVPAVVAACEDAIRVDSTYQGPDSVRILLDAGADINFKSKRGRTLIHYAADNLNFRSTKTLLLREIDVNAKDASGVTALHLACKNSHWMTTEHYNRWKDAGMYSGSYEYANWHCSIESTLVLYALHVGDADPYIGDDHGATPLHIASKAGNPRIAAIVLLHTGPGLLYDYPDFKERLPWHYAANSSELIHMLLHYHSCNELDPKKYFQVEELNENKIQQMRYDLIEKCTYIWHQRKYTDAHPGEVVDESAHPLPWRRGACNASDKFGNTPLHYAALAGNVKVVEMYLELEDVDPSVANDCGETALHFAVAQRECAIRILRRLEELGKDVPNEVELERVRTRRSKGWVEGEKFVAALRDKYSYGVYDDEN
ncbi:hypothetical protein ACMFMG_011125 [Clarireedia jacksonii]